MANAVAARLAAIEAKLGDSHRRAATLRLIEPHLRPDTPGVAFS